MITVKARIKDWPYKITDEKAMVCGPGGITNWLDDPKYQSVLYEMGYTMVDGRSGVDRPGFHTVFVPELRIAGNFISAMSEASMVYFIEGWSKSATSALIWTAANMAGLDLIYENESAKNEAYGKMMDIGSWAKSYQEGECSNA